MKYVMLVLYVPVDSGSSFFLSIFFLSLPVRLCVTVVSCDLLSRGVLLLLLLERLRLSLVCCPSMGWRKGGIFKRFSSRKSPVDVGHFLSTRPLV